MGSASGSFPTDIEVFGEPADGTVVHRYRLTNGRGMAVQVLTYGAIVQSMEVPDRHGQPANIVLGFATLDAYVRDNRPYFGAVVGRYANRIANGTFTLNGTTYRLPVNDPPDSLHGGTEGFDKRVWQAEPDHDGDSPGLRLVYQSPDGEMGYPGTLTAEVHYALTPGNELRIDYRARTASPARPPAPSPATGCSCTPTATPRPTPPRSRPASWPRWPAARLTSARPVPSASGSPTTTSSCASVRAMTTTSS